MVPQSVPSLTFSRTIKECSLGGSGGGGGGSGGGQGRRKVEGSEDVKCNFHLVNLRVSVTNSDFCTHTENQLKAKVLALSECQGLFCFANKGPRHVRRGNLLDAGQQGWGGGWGRWWWWCLCREVAAQLRFEAGPLDPRHTCHLAAPLQVEIPEQNKSTGAGEGLGQEEGQ